MASRKVSYLVNHVIRWQASNEIIISSHSTHDLFHKDDNIWAYVKRSRKIIRLLGRAFRKKMPIARVILKIRMLMSDREEYAVLYKDSCS
jgi:hypothetical protein